MTQDSNVLISPVGRLVYPNLNVATVYQNKADGKPAYYTDLDVEGEEGRKFEELIVAHSQDYAKRIGKRTIDLDNVIREAKDDSGPLVDTRRFRFKVSVIQTKRGVWDRKPAFYRADGTPFKEEPRLGAGTVAQIAFTIYEWKAATQGMTLQPEGVLVHELKEGSAARTVDRSYQSLFGGAQAAPAAATAPSARGSADF